MAGLAYYAVLLVTYLGLLAGIIIGIIASEEKKGLKRYLKWAKMLMMWLILAVSLYYHYSSIPRIALIAVFALYLLSRRVSDPLTYFLLGIIFYASSANADSWAVISSIIFIFGIPAGMLVSSKRLLGNVKPLIRNMGFAIAGTALPLLASYL